MMPRVAPPAPNIKMFAPSRLHAEIDAQVSQQSDAVRVVAVYFAATKRNRIDGTGGAGAFAHLIDELCHLALVRYRDVQAFAARALKLTHCRLKFFGRYLQQLVLHVLARLQGEQAVDNGRATVRHRVSHDAVSIDGRCCFCHSLSQRAAAIE